MKNFEVDIKNILIMCAVSVICVWYYDKLHYDKIFGENLDYFFFLSTKQKKVSILWVYA